MNTNPNKPLASSKAGKTKITCRDTYQAAEPEPWSENHTMDTTNTRYWNQKTYTHNGYPKKESRTAIGFNYKKREIFNY